MKKTILFVAIAISVGVYAQVRTQVKPQSELKGNAVNVDHRKEQALKVGTKVAEEKLKITPKPEMIPQKDTKNIKAESGGSKAAEAKLRAKEVTTKSDADALVRMSKADTKELITSIDLKMLEARTKLSQKLDKHEITQTEFDSKLKQLMEFEKRKNAIILELQ